jgi:hypothetical protein
MLSIAFLALAILICDLWISWFYIWLFLYSQNIISEMFWAVGPWVVLWLFIIISGLLNWSFSRFIMLFASPFILKAGIRELSPIFHAGAFMFGKYDAISYFRGLLEIILAILLWVAFVQSNKKYFFKEKANI